MRGALFGGPRTAWMRAKNSMVESQEQRVRGRKAATLHCEVAHLRVRSGASEAPKQRTLRCETTSAGMRNNVGWHAKQRRLEPKAICLKYKTFSISARPCTSVALSNCVTGSVNNSKSAPCWLARQELWTEFLIVNRTKSVIKREQNYSKSCFSPLKTA